MLPSGLICGQRRTQTVEIIRSGSLCNSPSFMSGATQMLSLSVLMCREKGLVLLFTKEALRMLPMCAFVLLARCLLTADLILR